MSSPSPSGKSAASGKKGLDPPPIDLVWGWMDKGKDARFIASLLTAQPITGPKGYFYEDKDLALAEIMSRLGRVVYYGCPGGDQHQAERRNVVHANRHRRPGNHRWPHPRSLSKPRIKIRLAISLADARPGGVLSNGCVVWTIPSPKPSCERFSRMSINVDLVSGPVCLKPTTTSTTGPATPRRRWNTLPSIWRRNML
jgi:hypothetical protein